MSISDREPALATEPAAQFHHEAGAVDIDVRGHPSPGSAIQPEVDYGGEPPLEIPSLVVAAMIEHCLAEAPNEACGVLAGVSVPRVESIYRMRNHLESPTRYDADPRDIIAAVRSMRARGERMLALYHSHPACSAIPSRVDLEQNYYGSLPRVIVSLRNGQPEVRVWRLDEATFHELAWSEVDLAAGVDT
jgi:proteasome lid subunit RPN8/RPN11